jgi:hypothetical protein
LLLNYIDGLYRAWSSMLIASFGINPFIKFWFSLG